MSNKWLFFPTPASGADWSDAWASSDFLGSLVADGNAGQSTNPFSLVTGTLVSNLNTFPAEFTRGSATVMTTRGPNYVTMYYTHLSRYMVWFLDGHGWQKSFQSAWYTNSSSTWTVNFFASGGNVGDYSPAVFAMFTADPGDVSTWTDYNGPTGYHQEITWTMTGESTATVSSTGQDIINSLAASGLVWTNGAPRFWNGTESQNFGANSSNQFASGAANDAWWKGNYQIEAEKNGGGFVSIGNPVSGDGQSSYFNVYTSAMPGWGVAFVSEVIIKFRVSAAS